MNTYTRAVTRSVTSIMLASGMAGFAAPPLPGDTDAGQWVDSLGRGRAISLGRFDADGNFIPDPTYPPITHAIRTGRLTGRIRHRLTPIGDNQPTYEHRSGRLIRGWVTRGGFVPEAGTKVVEFREDRDLANPDRAIWNMPKALGRFWTPERREQFPEGLPAGPAPPQPDSRRVTSWWGHPPSKGGSWSG